MSNLSPVTVRLDEETVDFLNEETDRLSSAASKVPRADVIRAALRKFQSLPDEERSKLALPGYRSLKVDRNGRSKRPEGEG